MTIRVTPFPIQTRCAPPPPPPPLCPPPPEKLLWLELLLCQLLELLLPERKLRLPGLREGLLATNELAVVFNMEKKLELTLLSD